MANEFFAGFSPEEKREVGLALERVSAIREAYAAAVVVGQQAAGADLAASSDPVVRKEVSEALSAARSSSTSLMAELVDYTNVFAMSPNARAGASRFVSMLDRAQLGDRDALATLQAAKNELGEASRARADFGVDDKGRAAASTPTVGAGDRKDDDRRRAIDPDLAAGPGVVEVVSRPGAKVNTLALPESFVDRYIRAGDSLVDARSPARLILVDRGRRLDAPAEYSSETVKAMVDIAEARGWSRLSIKGEPQFKAAVYAEAASRGLAVTGYKPTEAERAVAELQANKRLQKAQEAPAAKVGTDSIAEAYKRAKTPAERKAATEKFPQLAKAFAMEAVATNTAKSIGSDRARTAFMDRFRDTIAFDLAQGREMADIRLRKPMFKDQRDRDQVSDRGR
jgi:conjugative element/phage-associated large polyvalent protein